MRTEEQIDLIKQTHSKPVQLLKVVNEAKVKQLLEYYNQSDEKITKNTGPKVLYVEEGQDLIDDLLVILRLQFGNFKVRSAHFFEVDRPHVLHIDDDFDYPNSYKAFTIPLWVESGSCDKIKLVMFDQYYYGGPVKFFKGEDTVEQTYYNTPLFDYSDVENINNLGIPEVFRSTMLSHLKIDWLEGLSVNSFFPWTIGSIIAFDSLMIHCSSNFNKVGIKKKIGLSIFTEM